jgi:hypothetical protein
MAIYLDEQTRSWLERATRNISESDFIGKRVKKMLEADRLRLEEIAKCDHVARTYVGEKECCCKCGSYFEPGMGESWTLKEVK